MTSSKLRGYAPYLAFTISLIYYIALSAKQFTWIFVSGDAGDWLATSHFWSAPQPFGSPLYILLGHAADAIPGDLVTKMTMLLSAWPAAVTVTVVFLIVRKMTGKMYLASLSWIILLGAAIFTSQATILEEYSLAVMFVVLGFWAYINNRLNWMAIALGLGTAVHIMVLPITVLWFFVNAREWRTWVKSLPLFIVFGVLPYGLTLWQLAYSEPLLVAGGGLSLEALNSYLGSTSVVGSLAIVDAPERIGMLVGFLVMSLGLAWMPIIHGVRKPMSKPVMMILACVGFSVWYYATSLDPTTWTFLIYAIPMLAVLAGLGMRHMPVKQAMVIGLCAIVLVVANTIWLNADKLSKNDPVAMEYVNEVQSLPNGSFVLTHRGGFETMALWYTISLGKNVIPLYFEWEENLDKASWVQYRDWMHEEYGLSGDNPMELAQSVLDNGKPLFVLVPLLNEWEPAIQHEVLWSGLSHYDVVTGVEDVTVYSQKYLDMHKADGTADNK